VAGAAESRADSTTAPRAILVASKPGGGPSPGPPLADLFAHSTWALLERRGRALEDDSALAGELLGRVEALLDEGDLSAQSRRELEQAHYGVRALRS
jgi:hypothetical protein